MQWLFGTVHEIPACLDFYFGREHTPEASSIAGKQVYSRSSPADPVTLDARLTDSLYHWVNDCVRRYDLEGPSDVLEAVCRCAIGQGAGDDIFESDTSWHDLPRCTVQLYHDLGIIRFSASGESMGFSAKYGCNR